MAVRLIKSGLLHIIGMAAGLGRRRRAHLYALQNKFPLDSPWVKPEIGKRLRVLFWVCRTLVVLEMRGSLVKHRTQGSPRRHILWPQLQVFMQIANLLRQHCGCTSQLCLGDGEQVRTLCARSARVSNSDALLVLIGVREDLQHSLLVPLSDLCSTGVSQVQNLHESM